ncbi:MAG: hypothetical protein O7H39_11125 [Gammaproteobacteria bacterium]|nr:hypothetical protein [Gammaproteobacteria bacterium]
MSNAQIDQADSPADSPATQKPSYIGLLNAISVGEGRGYELLRTWAHATPDASLKSVLETVAIREHEHAVAFEKRLCELGFGVRTGSSGDFETQIACLKAADVTDTKKFETLLGYGNGEDQPDPFGKLFDDTTIDPITGGLLGRYVAEERDSGRMLRAEYDRLAKAETTAVQSSSGGEEAALSEISVRLEKLTATLEELKALKL